MAGAWPAARFPDTNAWQRHPYLYGYMQILVLSHAFHTQRSEKNKQQNIINQLYLGEKFEGYNNVKREIEKKLNGYKNQDIKKEKYEKW